MNKDRETAQCLICRKPSGGVIGYGHVRRGAEVILVTFCSRGCCTKSPKADRFGCYGKWRRWMGASAPPDPAQEGR